MHVLGLTAFRAGSAAALVVDGELVAVQPEERWTRNRHEAAFPRGGVRACLARAGIEPHDLDALVLAEKPSRSFERLLFQELSQYPRTWRSFPHLLLSWLGDRLWARSRIAQEIGLASERVLFVDSQRARAAWTFFASPCATAAILVSDEPREGAATTLLRGAGTALEVLGEVHDPNALTAFAAQAARHLGLAGVEDLVRLAHCAESGRASRRHELARVLEVGADGSHVLTLAGLTAALGPPRMAGAPLEAEHADAAASVMRALGDALLACACELHRRTGLADVCLGGGLADVPTWNARILSEGPFARVWIPPAPGEIGAAAGAALYASCVLGGARPRPIEHAFLAEDVLADDETPADATVDECELVERAARVLAAGGLVGWMQGRAELGQRALGHRAVLANPRALDVLERLARAVGGPAGELEIACALPAEQAREHIDIPAGGEGASRFLALRCTVREGARAALGPSVRAGGWVAAQTVEQRADPRLHALLARFGVLTGSPVLLQVPLARRGEPTVRRETDARALQRQGGLELLCVEGRVYDGVPTESSNAAGATSP